MTRLAMRDMVAAAAACYGRTPAQLLGPSRERRATSARQVACYLGARVLHLSTGEIGRYLHRDHTTVMHAQRTVAAAMKADAATREAIDAILAGWATGAPLPAADLAPPPPQPLNLPAELLELAARNLRGKPDRAVAAALRQLAARIERQEER